MKSSSEIGRVNEPLNQTDGTSTPDHEIGSVNQPLKGEVIVLAFIYGRFQ